MKSKPKVVVDTNVFMNSWFDNDEICDKITDLIERNKIKLLFSQDTIGELFYIIKKYSVKHMSSKKPRLALLYNVAELFYESESIDTRLTLCPKIEDKYDEMLVKCAIEGKADFLISCDGKSGMHDNKEIEKLGIKAVKPEEFIEIYEKDIRAS